MNFWQTATLNTAVVIAGVVVVTSLIALPFAWLSERSDLPGAQALRQVLTLPYVIPSYLLAVAWIILANPGVGWINAIYHRSGGEGSLIDIYGIGGVIFVESSALFSILYLTMKASFSRVDPSLEESARLAGAGPVRVFFSISLPILKNSILLGVLTVALASFASFGVPAMIGNPARRFLLTTGLYQLLQQGSLNAYSESLVVAGSMTLVAITIVIGMKFFATKRLGFMGSKVSRPALFTLGRARYPVAILVWTIWGSIVAIPLLALVVSSFQNDPSSFEVSNFGLQAWRKVFFELPEFRESLKNSLVTASLAAFIIVIVSTLVAILKWRAARYNVKWQRALTRGIEESSFLLYSLPGTVLALLLLTSIAWLGKISGGQIRLSNTLTVLVIALLAKYFSLGINTLVPNAQLVHASLVESAQLAGASSWQRIRFVWLPLLRPAMIAATLLVLMPCLSELTMTILLYGPGTQNLGVLLFEQQEYADRASAAVIGTLLLASVIPLQYLISKLQRGPA